MRKAKNRLTAEQLQQKVIYLKAELAKYRQQVSNYEENYHYRLLEELKDEKEALVKKNQMLEDSIKETQQAKEKLTNDLMELNELLAKIQGENKALVKVLEEKNEALEKSQGASNKSGKPGQSVIKGKSIPVKSAERLKETPFFNSQVSSTEAREAQNEDWFLRNTKKK